jgi:two-component system CheB/CheR fusion protein
LIVDDYPDIPAVISRLLVSFGHQTACANSGREAIEIAKTFEPDIGLVDLGLPDISGFEVAPQLRELAGRRRMFLVAVSGWASPEDRVRALAAGFDHHVLKPIDGAVITRIIKLAQARALGRRDSNEMPRI